MQSDTDGILCHLPGSVSIILLITILLWSVHMMYTRVSSPSPLRPLHSKKSLLLLCYLAGFLLGIAFAYRSQPFVSLMRGAVSGPVTIVGLGAVLFLPYLLTVSAVLFSCSGILFAVAFFKAFLFGACAAALDVSFVDAGWVVRSLLMFSDFAGFPVLIWLSWRLLDAQRERIGTMMIAGGLLLTIGVFDFLLIAPFLESVM